MSHSLNSDLPDQEVVSAWLIDLAGKDADLRLNAVRELSTPVAVGPDVINAVVSAVLEDFNDELKFYSNAAVVLCKIDPKAAEATSSLKRLLAAQNIDKDLSWGYDIMNCGARGTAPWMIKRTGEIGDFLRAMAAFALAQLGPGASDAVPELVGSLTECDSLIRGNAAFALGRIGPAAAEAVPALIRLLDDPEEGVIGDAASALGALGELASEAIPPLFERCLSEKDSANPFYEALAKIGPPVLPHFVSALVNGSEDERTFAAHFLDAHRHRMLLSIASALGTHRDEHKNMPCSTASIMRWIDVREGNLAVLELIELALNEELWEEPAANAIESGGWIGIASLKSLPALRQVFKQAAAEQLQHISASETETFALMVDAAFELRFASQADLHRADCAQVAKFRQEATQNPAFESQLLGLATDYTESWSRRHLALYTLSCAGMGKAAVPALIEALSNGRASVRRDATRALWVLGAEAEDAVPALFQRLSDEAYSVRDIAEHALREIGCEAVAGFVNALQADDSDVRRRASRSLGWIATSATEIVPALVRSLDDVDEYVRAYSAMSLGGFGRLAEPGTFSLIHILETDAPFARQRAAYALTRIGLPAKAALPALVKTLSHEDRDLRSWAAIAIGAIDPEAQSLVPSREDEQLLAWFDEIKISQWLERLQIFWCIGWLDNQALLSMDTALGVGNLCKALKKALPKDVVKRHKVSNGYIRVTIELLEELFNVKPFSGVAWNDDELMADFRTKRTEGTRDSRWTPRGRKAWQYVDRYLAIKDLIPKMNLSLDD